MIKLAQLFHFCMFFKWHNSLSIFCILWNDFCFMFFSWLANSKIVSLKKVCFFVVVIVMFFFYKFCCNVWKNFCYQFALIRSITLFYIICCCVEIFESCSCLISLSRISQNWENSVHTYCFSRWRFLGVLSLISSKIFIKNM